MGRKLDIPASTIWLGRAAIYEYIRRVGPLPPAHAEPEPSLFTQLSDRIRSDAEKSRSTSADT